MRQIGEWREDVRRRRALRTAVLFLVLLALSATGASGWCDRPFNDGFGRSSAWLD